MINNITLSDQIKEWPKLQKTKMTGKELAITLIEGTLKAYNYSANAFFALGIAILCVFKNLFLEKCCGFPILMLFGGAHSGKTNLLKLICAIFGLKESYIQSGAATINRIWYTLCRYSCIPAIFDEFLASPFQKNYFGTLIKSVYDGKPRGRMSTGTKESVQYVNSPLIFSSNFLPPEEEAVSNRIVITEFDKGDFNPKFAADMNELRDKHLSALIIDIVKIKQTDILDLFEKSKDYIKEHSEEKLNEREINNLAIGLSGIKVLYNIAEMEISEKLEKNIIKFIANYNDIREKRTALDEFLGLIPYLISEDKLSGGVDVEIRDGILKVHMDKAYRLFSYFYRVLNGEKAPTKREILACAKFDDRVDKDAKQVTKSLTLCGKKKRCLVVNIKGHEELELLEYKTNEPPVMPHNNDNDDNDSDRKLRISSQIAGLHRINI